MRACHRAELGSFREPMEDLVPLFGTDPSTTPEDPDEMPTAVIGMRGSAVYEINQYLFERSRH